MGRERKVKKFLIIALILLPSAVMAQHPVLRCLPEVESEELRAIFADPWTMYYDHETMPRVVQHRALGPLRVYSQDYQFNSFGNQTNPANEYPWKIGGGLHGVDREDIDVVKFYWHPDRQPVEYFYATRRNFYANVVREQMIDVECSVDSVFGEIIALVRDGRSYVIEVRTLTREADVWRPTTYRQHNETTEMANMLWAIGYQELADSIGNLPIHERTLVDPLHDPPAITAKFIEVDLPQLPEDAVRKLLDAPLREVVYPSEITASVSQVIPAGYRPAHVGVDRSDCMKCHKHAGNHVLMLGWRGDGYGYESGGSKDGEGFGIISFHPFEPSSINGIPRINQRLIASGHLRKRAQ